MSRRRVLEQHVRRLADLGEIMRSMKNLALMEQRKIAHVAPHQTQLIDSLESIATDFLAFHPEVAAPPNGALTVYVLVGSQRGFCGDFNDAILNAFSKRAGARTGGAEVIAVGERLRDRMRPDFANVSELDGPNVSEEIAGVLNHLLEVVADLQERHEPIDLTVFHHTQQNGTVLQTSLLPPFQDLTSKSPRLNTPPILNVPPSSFWSDLIDQYLFSKLHEIFFTSLLVENRRRVDHMTGAVKHLEEKTEELGRKSRALRLEEITEEIEVILLSAGMEKSVPVSGYAASDDSTESG